MRMRRCCCLLLCAIMLCTGTPQAYAAEDAAAVCAKTQDCTLSEGHEGECRTATAGTEATEPPKEATEQNTEASAPPKQTPPDPTTAPSEPPKETSPETTAPPSEPPKETTTAPSEPPKETSPDPTTVPSEPPKETSPETTALPSEPPKETGPETTEPPKEQTQAQKIQARIDALPDAERLGAMSEEERKSVYEEIGAIGDAIEALETGADTLDCTRLDAAMRFFTDKPTTLQGGVASVEGQEYPTLADAIANALDGQTVTLMSDTEVSSQIGITNNITLDLNGHTITNHVISERLFSVTASSLTIDGTKSGSGMTIPAGNAGSFGFIKLCAPTNLTINGGTYSGNTDSGALIKPFSRPGVGDASNAVITLNNVNMNTNNWFISSDTLDTLSLNVTGGVYTNTSTCGFGIDIMQPGPLSFNGVTVNSAVGPCVEISGAAATFENCDFKVTDSNATYSFGETAISVSWGGTALVKSGTYTSSKYGAYVYSSGGAITIEGGTISAPVAAKTDVDANSYPDAQSHIVISGGVVSGELATTKTGSESITVTGGNISGLTETTLDGGYNITITGGKFDTDVSTYVPEGNKANEGTDGKYTVGLDMAVAVAEINGRGYTSLQAAVDASAPGDTITLLTDCTGDGVIVQSYNDFTLDFAGHTYTIDGDTVGSTGTETNGFQLLRSSDIVMKNGTIRSSKAKILIQNYCNLTLENMNLDGSAMPSPDCYVLSDNCGDVNITGSTSITAAEGNVAFDLYYWPPSYADGVRVTVNTTGKITGRIEYAASGDATDGDIAACTALTFLNGELDGEFAAATDAAQIQISGGKFQREVPQKYCAPGFYPLKNLDGSYGVHEHVAGAPEIQNVVEASCAKAGSYEEVTYCELCGAETGRIGKEIPKLAHSFGPWVVTVKPVNGANGEQQRVCRVCGETETRATTHDFVLTHDDTKHWYQCMDTDCRMKADEEQHGYGAWTVTKQPTETEKGSRERVCVLCGFTQTAELPLLTHTHKVRFVQAKPATCTEAGNKAYYICVCGALFSDEACTVEIKDKDSVNIPALGHHDYNGNGVCDICAKRLVSANPTKSPYVPKTGDTSNIGLWIGIMGGSTLILCAVAALLVTKSKRKKDGRDE